MYWSVYLTCPSACGLSTITICNSCFAARKYLNYGDEEALAALKAAFGRQERLRAFLEDNRWLTRPLVDRIEQEALTDPQSGLYKDLLAGSRADSKDSVLAAVKPYLDSGSDDTFVEFVRRLQEQLNAKVQTMKSLVTGLNKYVGCAKSDVSSSKATAKGKTQGKATVAAKVENPMVMGMRKSMRLSARASRSGRKVKSTSSTYSTDQLQKASGVSQSPHQGNSVAGVFGTVVEVCPWVLLVNLGTTRLVSTVNATAIACVTT